MKFELEIECDNDAFRSPNGNPDEVFRDFEVAKILNRLLKVLEHDNINVGERILLQDSNGNRVGAARFLG